MATATSTAPNDKAIAFPGPKAHLPQPCVLVIFGAPGDLSWRKLLPAVYNLNVDGLLPSHFAVVGFGLPASNDPIGDPDEFLRARAKDGIGHFSRQPLDESHWTDFARALYFIPGSFNDARAYGQLKAKLEAVDQQFGIPGSRVFYLSIPPQFVGMCVQHLKEAGLVHDASDQRAFTRVIVEKPIGRDLESARQVIRDVAQAFEESQTYRIDHYLGKETVQNLLVLRFANSIFEPLWNQKYIDHVQITVAEEEGVARWDPETGKLAASRAGYYEGIGALRDMVQNHMLQVLCLTAMEPPYSLEPDVVRDAKAGVLHCLRPIKPEEVGKQVVRAQYIDGDEFGQAVPGYRYEVRKYYEEMLKKPVPAESVNSTTETFVAMRVFIDNWRWAGVPFYLRTGKRLPKRSSEVAIQFKDVPQVLFNANPDVPLEPTVLSLRVQPEEGLSLRLASKLPGPKVRIYPVKMEFNYSSSFGGTTPEAYERLILDVMAGDATLFMRRDAVEAAWKFVMPILHSWENSRARFLPEYRAGTWGPLEADRLIEDDGLVLEVAMTASAERAVGQIADPRCPAGAAVTVPLRDVDHELRRQLLALRGSANEPVLQARMSNLVVYCDSRERADAIAAQVVAIAAAHPTRVLLLIGEQGAETSAPTATVLVHGGQQGGRAHSCSEVVTIAAGGAAVDRLPFAVRALVIGDLPTNLWWAAPQPPPLAGPLLYELSENAEQIIYDSIGWREPVRGVAATAAWLTEAERPSPGGRWRVASDLNWRRLKYWRRLVAQALDPATAPGAAESVTEVLAEHGPHAVVQAWELVGWLSQRLGWQLQGGRVTEGTEVSWEFAAAGGTVLVRIRRLPEGPPNLRRLRLACTLADRPAALHLGVQEENRLAVTLEGIEGEPRTITVPPLAPAELIGRQLSDRERDPAFRESMAIARRMADIVLG